MLYGLIGLLVWPTEETGRDGSSAGAGLIGERGRLIVWSVLWAGAAVLWCLSVNRAADATSEALKAASGSRCTGSRAWRASLAGTTRGDGEAIAVVLAILSLAIGAGVWTRFRREALLLGMLISVAYWLFRQSLGGLTTGRATDPNAGPLFVLLALALLPDEDVSAKSVQDAFNKGETRMQDSRQRISMGSGHRWAALGVLLAIVALAVSGCGGSSGAKTEATVAFKPMAVWDASHRRKDAAELDEGHDRERDEGNAIDREGRRKGCRS